MHKHKNKIIFILDIRKSKPKLFIINKDKCIYSLTSGIVYKQLLMKKKSVKKTEKMLNLMLKATALKFSDKIKYKKFIMHLKGTRSNIFNTLVLMERHFNNKFSLIYEPEISFGTYKFKKIKAIKRRLRKKFSRLIKN